MSGHRPVAAVRPDPGGARRIRAGADAGDGVGAPQAAWPAGAPAPAGPGGGAVRPAAARRDWNFSAGHSRASNACRDHRDTADHRLIMSAFSVVMLVVGVAGLLLDAAVARTVGLGCYLFVGIGAAPWVLARSMRLPTRLAMTALTTLCVLTFVGTSMLQLGAWYPVIAFAVLALSSVALHVYGCRSAVRDRVAGTAAGGNVAGGNVAAGTAGTGSAVVRLVRKHYSSSLAMSLSGGATCLSAMIAHRHLEPTLWGFLLQIGPLWYIGLALVVVSFAVSRAHSDASVAVAVLILVLILTGTPALVYDGPRSQSAAKHVEFIQQIRRLHRIDTSVAVYVSWPGFFAAMAWVCEIAGIRDPMRLATAWPAVLGVFKLAALRFFAGTLLTSRTTAWVAVALAVLADPIGADYFSPQSVGFVLGLLVFAIALSHYDVALKVAALTAAGAALAVSHQLSPYLIGGTLGILAVFRQARPWWLPVTVLGPALGWALIHLSAIRSFLYLGDVGNAKNFRPPRTTATEGLSRLPVVDASVATLVVGVLLLGGAAAVVLFQRRRSIEAWALACAPAAGLVVISVNPYGQEGIFRATLFGIPWLALLAAQLFPWGTETEPNLELLIVLAILSVTFLTASFALDATNVIRPADRAAFDHFYRRDAGPQRVSYLLMLGPGDLPSTPPTRDRTHLTLSRNEVPGAGVGPLAEPPDREAERLTRSLLAYAGPDAADTEIFAIWSPVSDYYGWQYGLQTPPKFVALRDAFDRSPQWSVAFAADRTVLFRYDPPRARPGGR